MKPEGIEDSLQSSAISLALLGIPTTELKEEDLIVEITEMGSTGNLNISWKLKQMLGITVMTKQKIITLYWFLPLF